MVLPPYSWHVFALYYLQLRAFGLLGVPGVHAQQHVIQGLEPGHEAIVVVNHVLEAQRMLETVTVSCQ